MYRLRWIIQCYEHGRFALRIFTPWEWLPLFLGHYFFHVRGSSGNRTLQKTTLKKNLEVTRKNTKSTPIALRKNSRHHETRIICAMLFACPGCIFNIKQFSVWATVLPKQVSTCKNTLVMKDIFAQKSNFRRFVHRDALAAQDHIAFKSPPFFASSHCQNVDSKKFCSRLRRFGTDVLQYFVETYAARHRNIITVWNRLELSRQL